MDTGTTHRAASTFTRPAVPAGAAAGVEVRFIRIISSAPGMHTNNDTAEAVPMAIYVLTLQAVSTGTVRVPPLCPAWRRRLLSERR